MYNDERTLLEDPRPRGRLADHRRGHVLRQRGWRGEAVILNCGGFSIVRAMERGLTPTEACLEVAGDIVRRTKERRLRDEDGRVNFDVKLYAARKDGAYGGASIRPGGRFAVCDEKGARTEACPSVY